MRAGDGSGAIQKLRQIARFEPGQRTLIGIYLRGQAYLEAKSGAEAGAEFRKILDNRGITLRSILYPLSQLGFARSRALAGDNAGARKAYAEFFATWKDADSDIPVLVQARAEYAQLGK